LWRLPRMPRWPSSSGEETTHQHTHSRNITELIHTIEIIYICGRYEYLYNSRRPRLLAMGILGWRCCPLDCWGFFCELL
jgi:hypothetical protein